MKQSCPQLQGELCMGRVQVSTAWCLGYSHPTASTLQQGANIPKLESRRKAAHCEGFPGTKKIMYMVSNFI